eukprot:930864-Pyramimonas_sp.AAC.1
MSVSWAVVVHWGPLGLSWGSPGSLLGRESWGDGAANYTELPSPAKTTSSLMMLELLFESSKG